MHRTEYTSIHHQPLYSTALPPWERLLLVSSVYGAELGSVRCCLRSLRRSYFVDVAVFSDHARTRVDARFSGFRYFVPRFRLFCSTFPETRDPKWIRKRFGAAFLEGIFSDGDHGDSVGQLQRWSRSSLRPAPGRVSIRCFCSRAYDPKRYVSHELDRIFALSSNARQYVPEPELLLLCTTNYVRTIYTAVVVEVPVPIVAAAVRGRVEV